MNGAKLVAENESAMALYKLLSTDFVRDFQFWPVALAGMSMTGEQARMLTIKLSMIHNAIGRKEEWREMSRSILPLMTRAPRP